MRVMTRRAAGLDDRRWDVEARQEVASLFDGLAQEWHTRASPERLQVVVDALDRGLSPARQAGTVLEAGSGIGTYSTLLADRWDHAISFELSPEMAALAPAGPAHRVLADASQLPVPDASAAAVVLINMFLFPDELVRVLAPGGRVVWVNSSGESTPIHLLPEEVAAALPGGWRGTAARAGAGLWTVLHRC